VPPSNHHELHLRGPTGRGARGIQQNTFTRWCNEHLKCVHKRIGDLQRDLSDGLRLIALLEVLSQKKMGRKYHPRPNFRQMKLENVSVALEFLEREHIKLGWWGNGVG
uniref:Calponin-homology (CH) domain-containing protein n=1 Tax=Bubo bubo TaxID=30461 RepID=A0A8C0F4I7_BUBBB